MGWTIEFDEAAKKELARLDRQVARRLLYYLTQRVISLKDPRSVGQALKGSKLGEFWKYRVGDFRIIASIQDQKMIILVLRVGNRREIYR
ncbi:type II toxin-antitoxin system RelE/ParE family toxin [Limnohabitans sp. Rim8]|uniref:type II toxin-antitoxin system RelE family toxin n=1 Tax=Limnohabitans sp. Rim8 TaxID=1100718 RepID=UPI002620CD1C|nr:type II toxin-antitoxin system RelE/ParE family toxin [Limnohabitans sp. Rim8]